MFSKFIVYIPAADGGGLCGEGGRAMHCGGVKKFVFNSS